MAAQQQSLRKRQQISSANKTMFLWVAIASGVTAMALVVSFLLFQRLVFNEKVLAAKSETVANLRNNNEVADQLKQNVRVRNTDETLRSLRAGEDDEPIQVIIDALPSTANSAALGASLQSPHMLGASGVTLESLKVDPVVGVEGDEDVSTDSEASTEKAITFQFQVSTSASGGSKLKAILERLERSIRVVNLTELTVERQGGRLMMTGKGEGYYEPARTLELQKKAIEP